MDVHDGDTITVAPGGALDTPISIRLYGIDAPELTQKYGTASRDALRRMLPRESSVQVISMGMDRYGRSTGLIIHDGRGINAAMLREGQAWLYKRYCRAKFCRRWLKDVRKAQQQKAGLWESADVTAPWVWRAKTEKAKNGKVFLK